MSYLRLRLARRLGLLGPTLRFERRVEAWATDAQPPRQHALTPVSRRQS